MYMKLMVFTGLAMVHAVPSCARVPGVGPCPTPDPPPTPALTPAQECDNLCGASGARGFMTWKCPLLGECFEACVCGRCFDASSTFTTRDGAKRMDEVMVGDEVLAARSDGSLVWDKIAVDASHGGTNTTEYISIATNTDRTLTLTSNHYLHATRGDTKTCCSADTMVTAEKVAVGDTVWVAESAASDALTPVFVTAVDKVQRVGQYNFWLDGEDDPHFRSLVVNGVATVSFTDDFRLVNTLGADVANHLVDPLRELVRLGVALPKNVGHDAPWVGLEVQNVVADCVESGMKGCSDEQIRQRLERILHKLELQLGETQADALLQAFEALAARHLRSVPASVRRLATTVAANFASMHVTTLVAHEARSTAMRVCETSDPCKREMVVNVHLHPNAGYMNDPLQVLTLTISVAICVLVLIVAALVCALHRAVKGLTTRLCAPATPAKVAEAKMADELSCAEAGVATDAASQV